MEWSLAEDPGDAVHRRGQFILQLAPGNSRRPIAGGSKNLVATAIAVESDSRPMRPLAIRLDGQALLLPEEVDLQPLTEDPPPDIAARARQASVNQCLKQPGLQRAAQARWILIAPAPWQKKRLQGPNSPAALRVCKSEIKRVEVEKLMNRRLLDCAAQRRPPEQARQVDERARRRRAGNPIAFGDLGGIRVSATPSANTVYLAAGLTWHQHVDRRRHWLSDLPERRGAEVGDHRVWTTC